MTLLLYIRYPKFLDRTKLFRVWEPDTNKVGYGVQFCLFGRVMGGSFSWGRHPYARPESDYFHSGTR